MSPPRDRLRAIGLIAACSTSFAYAQVLHWKPLFVSPTDGIEHCKFVRTVSVWDDGGGPALFATGDFQVAGGQIARNVARWDGQSWTPLGKGLPNRIHSQLEYNGRLFVGSESSGQGLTPEPVLAWWDGLAWHELQVPDEPGPIDQLLEYDGRLVAVGVTVHAWDGANWSDLSAGFPRRKEVHDATIFADLPLLGGEFHVETESVLAPLLHWTGDRWRPFHPAIPDCTRASSVHSHEGSLHVACNGSEPNAISIWRLDGDRWVLLDTRYQRASANFASIDGDLFTSFSVPLDQWLALSEWPPLDLVEKWDGFHFVGIGAPLASVAALSLASFQGQLHSGGVHCMARIEDAAFAPVGESGMRMHSVSAWAELEGSLVAAGRFRMPTNDGTIAEGIARWNGATWHSMGNGLSGVGSATVVHEGILHAAGEFSIGSSRFSAVRWDGLSWSGTAVSPLTFKAFASHETELYAAAHFAPSALYRWTGTDWEPVPGITGSIDALSVHEDSLIVGGAISIAGHAGHATVARFDGLTWTLLRTTNSSAVSFAVYNGQLVAGFVLPYLTTDHSHVAMFDGANWHQLGDDIHASHLYTYRDELYALAVDLPGDGSLFRFDGDKWVDLELDGGYSFWPDDGSLFEYRGDLIIGGELKNQTGIPATGAAAYGPSRNVSASIVDATPDPLTSRNVIVVVELESSSAPLLGAVAVQASPGGACTDLLLQPVSATHSQALCVLKFSSDGPRRLVATYTGGAMSGTDSWQPTVSAMRGVAVGPVLFRSGFERSE